MKRYVVEIVDEDDKAWIQQFETKELMFESIAELLQIGDGEDLPWEDEAPTCLLAPQGKITYGMVTEEVATDIAASLKRNMN